MVDLIAIGMFFRVPDHYFEGEVMTIDEIKRALVEVRDICKHRTQCGGCPFDNEKSNSCPIMDRPDEWDIDDWKDDEEDENS